MAECLEFSVLLTRSVCSECGITYGLPSTYMARRQEDHGTFYCPNGHSQHFPGETESERLRKKLHAESLARESAERRAREAAAAKDAKDAELQRLKARAKAGVCPCCNRTFKQLAAHMKNKHPEFPK